MKKSLESFKDYIVQDVLCDLENITAKSMFGGFGIYRNGKIFAIIMTDEKLYLKGETEKSQKFFELNGGVQAKYEGKGKIMKMKYWSVPEEILENREEMQNWLQIVFEK
ncbi:MAG: TfoX family protein [Candidatus Pacebacteria bacterium]|nr:TfoX family protein [Candidatus Paceibacterota bacterium]